MSVLSDNKGDKPLPFGSILNGKYPDILVLAGVLVLTIIIYANTLNIGFVNFDDNLFIYNNFQLKYSLKDIFDKYFFEPYGGHYHPFTMMLYAIEYKLFGLNAEYYHIIKLIFHLVNICLVFYLIRSLSFNLAIQVIGALLFAVNPVNVETVTWISAQGTILFSFFFLISVFFYIRYLKTDKKSIYIFLSVLFYIFSLLSKSSAVTLPLLLVLIDYYYTKHITGEKWRISTKLVFSLLPFFLLAFMFGIIAMLSAQEFGTLAMSRIKYSAFDRIILALYSLVFYIIKLFVPVNLSVLYYNPQKIEGFFSVEYYLAPALILLIIWGISRSGYLRNKLVFGILFFLINISLFLQIVSVGNTIVSERYDYIPCIGIFIITGVLIYHLYNKAKRDISKVFIMILFTGFVIFLSITTWQRNKLWGNDIKLFTKLIEKYPEHEHAYFSRGSSRILRGDYKGAIEDNNKALEIYPMYVEAYHNRGLARFHLRKFDEAVKDFNKTLEIKDDFILAYMNRGRAKHELKDYKDAIDDFNRVEDLNDGFVLNYFYRAETEKAMKRYSDAIEDYTRSIELNPGFVKAYFERGTLKLRIKDYKGSITDFDKVIKGGKNYYYVYYNRGLAKQNINDLPGAIEDFTSALELKPRYYHAYNNRGIIHYKLKKFNSAISDYDKAIEINPGFADAFKNRGIAKFMQDNIDEACRDWQRAYDLGDIDAGRYIRENCK